MRIYKSKIAWGLFIPLYIYLLAITIFVAVHQLYIVVAVLLLVLVFLSTLLFRTQYIVDGYQLHIQSGFFYRLSIDIRQIIQIKDTKSILSSPATSFKNRIEIRYYKYNTIIISPAEKEAFLAQLQQIHPDIKIIVAAAKS